MHSRWMNELSSFEVLVYALSQDLFHWGFCLIFLLVGCLGFFLFCWFFALVVKCSLFFFFIEEHTQLLKLPHDIAHL